MELLVVVSLISLFLLLSIPRLQRILPMDHLGSSVRWIVSTVSEIKNAAVRNGRYYTLFMDMDNRLIWIAHGSMTKTDISTARKNGYRLPSDVRILDVEIPNIRKWPSGTAAISFSSLGYSSKALVHLEGKGGNIVSLLIEPFLSGVGYYERWVSFQDELQ